MSKAIVLLSGGLDSTTSLYWAMKKKKWKCYCLLFDYGQRHFREIQSAKKIARITRSPLQIVSVPLPWGGSSLIDRKKKIPTQSPLKIGKGKIPSTYVPARNTIFLSLALSWADVVKAENIVIGVNALDYSGYPDCRPNYYKAFQHIARLGTRLGSEEKKPPHVWTPLLRMTKTEIVRLGQKLKVPYEKTWSCYKGGKHPCGKCDSCYLRRKGFLEAKQEDPLLQTYKK